MEAGGGQKPQLMYFNVPGRVAGLRIMMHQIYGKDGWEDRRVEFKDWPQAKPTLPLQFMPLLTLPDGRKFHQADAMVRWAGKKAGLYPADPDVALLVDEMISTIYEALSKAPRPSNLVTKEMLPELWKEFTEGPMKMYFDYIQQKIEGPFFHGGDLTAADLTLYMLVNYFTNGEIPHVPTSYVNAWPGITANYAAVKAHPMVVAYDATNSADSTDAISEVKDFAEVDTSAIKQK
eukprot:TRINITY_DN53393_c0_g1_i1.p1 TRINITY_DN53393_c0_g1~~TRINITY_DN53393_c0_g1_i1.p1  ORF type:complete len:234 (-),score=41.60 TRINITY_DN53393_c0_g1_i1:34-735(-)